MLLLTKAIRKELPRLYSQENIEDPVVHCKFFTPWSNWTWYVLEFDGEDRFFGWVSGHEQELGYFSLKELMDVTGPMGLKIERDMYFEPSPLSKVKQGHGV